MIGFKDILSIIERLSSFRGKCIATVLVGASEGVIIQG